MSVSDKVKFGICRADSQSGELNEELLDEIFYKERYEYLLKGIFATTT